MKYINLFQKHTHSKKQMSNETLKILVDNDKECLLNLLISIILNYLLSTSLFSPTVAVIFTA